MKRGSHRVEEILILAHLPEDCETVFGWSPFDPSLELGAIITNFREQCQNYLNENSPSEFLPCAEGVLPNFEVVHGQPISEKDSSSQPVDLDGFHPDLTKMIVVDGKAIETYQPSLAAIHRSLTVQKDQGMNSLVHLILLDQLGTVEWSSLSFLPAWLGSIRKCHNQKELETTLGKISKIFGDAWWGIARNPYDAPCQNSLYHEPYIHPRHSHFIMPHSAGGEIMGRVYRAYQKLVPGMTSRVRDEALAKDLTPDQTRNLGQAVAMQEFLLLLATEQVIPQSKTPVSVDGIRRAIVEIPFDEQPDPMKVHDVDVLLIQLLSGKPQLTPRQAEILTSLNLGELGTVAIQIDRSDVRDQIGMVADLVVIDSFKVTLPHWEKKSTRPDVGFNERALGIRIVE